MAKMKARIHIKQYPAHPRFLDVAVANAAVKKDLEDIEGVEIIDIDKNSLQFTVLLNPLYDRNELIADIEALNNVTPIPPEFSDAFKE